MKEYAPKEGKLVPRFPGVLDRQLVRVGCGKFTKACLFSVRTLILGEGELPGHSICTLDDNDDITPWCGAEGLKPPGVSDAGK